MQCLVWYNQWDIYAIYWTHHNDRQGQKIILENVVKNVVTYILDTFVPFGSITMSNEKGLPFFWREKKKQ